jgi:carbonic anhydrase
MWIRFIMMGIFLVTITACSSSPSTIDHDDKNVAQAETKKEEQEIHWSYSGDTGSEYWSALNPSYKACGRGTEQSPINLEDVKANTSSEADIQINYQPSSFTAKNNGHTVQADANTDENSIVIDGKEYKLVQFHFHVPSEHQMDGKNLDMELHLVHKSEDDQLAVLGVLMKAGKENKTLAELWSKLPKEESEENIQLEEEINLSALLPQDKTAYHYNGSLTTPPCSEGVKWTVFAEPISVSQEQIDLFASVFPDNHRPVQPWNDRDAYEVLTHEN